MRVKIRGNIVDVPDYFEIRDYMLFNKNTKKYEGADNDIVTIIEGSRTRRGHVNGYTDNQIIPTYEWSTILVSAKGLYDGTSSIEFIHNTPVYEIKEEGI